MPTPARPVETRLHGTRVQYERASPAPPERNHSGRSLRPPHAKERLRTQRERSRHQGTSGRNRRHRDPQGHRPRSLPRRGPCRHGAERVRQVDPGPRPGRPPRLRGDRRRGHVPGRRPARPRARRARPPRAVPGLPVPALAARRDGRVLPAPGHQRAPQGRPGRQGRPDLAGRVRQAPARGHGPAQGRPRHEQPLPQRRVLGRREEARRDPADGDAAAEDRDPRRDRLGPRHRRPAGRGLGRERPARARPGRARHHALPAHPQLHHPGPRAHPGRRPDRQVWRRRSWRTSSSPAATPPSPARRPRHDAPGRRTRDSDRRVQVRLPRSRELRLQDRARASTPTWCARSRRTRTSPSGCSTSA